MTPTTTTSSTTILDNISKGVDTTTRILQLAPSIVALIQMLQALFPPKTGPAKKSVVMASLSHETPAVLDAASSLVDVAAQAIKTSPNS